MPASSGPAHPRRSPVAHCYVPGARRVEEDASVLARRFHAASHTRRLARVQSRTHHPKSRRHLREGSFINEGLVSSGRSLPTYANNRHQGHENGVRNGLGLQQPRELRGSIERVPNGLRAPFHNRRRPVPRRKLGLTPSTTRSSCLSRARISSTSDVAALECTKPRSIRLSDLSSVRK